MGRAPCCDKANVKKGPWSPEEDAKLKDYIEKYGTGGNWIALPQNVGLRRCGKSCRLRWLNYLRPNIKHGEFSNEEDRIICTLYATIGSRWSVIAAQLPGRTDNDIKNYWNTKLKKKLIDIMIPSTNQKSKPQIPNYLLQGHQSQVPSMPFQPPPNYNPTTKSLLGLDSFQIQPNLTSSSSVFTNYNFNLCLERSLSITPSSQDGLFGPIQGYNANYPQVKEKILLFGGNRNQALCSSFDGSVVSLGRDVKQEAMGIYMENNGLDEENPKFVLEFGKNSCETLMKTNEGYFGGNSMAGNNGFDQYGSLGEVKQLTDNGANDDHSYFNGFGDQNKTQDQRTMYYY